MPLSPFVLYMEVDTEMTPLYCMRTQLRRSTRRATVCRLAAFVWISLLGASGVSLAQTFEVVTSFVPAPNGQSPNGLIQASDGSFYGTTHYGAGYAPGTVFKVDAAGTLATLHSFTGSDGAYPLAGLIQASDGSLYGTTAGGGAARAGVVFRLRWDTTPPQVTCGASKTTLWPPDHHLIDVGFRYTAKDNFDANPATSISVTSDEPGVSSAGSIHRGCGREDNRTQAARREERRRRRPRVSDQGDRYGQRRQLCEHVLRRRRAA